jgi:hypothetical protein
MGSFVALVIVFLPPLLSTRTLKVEAEGLNETSVYVYPATHCHIPEDSYRIFHLGNPFVFV